MPDSYIECDFDAGPATSLPSANPIPWLDGSASWWWKLYQLNSFCAITQSYEDDLDVLFLGMETDIKNLKLYIRRGFVYGYME